MKARTSSTRKITSGPCIRGTRGQRRLALALRATAWGMAALLVAALLVTEAGCATQKPPQPIVVSVCPPIPVPARPEPPHVVLPAPDAAGNYCLTQAQVNDLARGIRDFKIYAAKLEAAVSMYNVTRTQAAEAERR